MLGIMDLALYRPLTKYRCEMYGLEPFTMIERFKRPFLLQHPSFYIPFFPLNPNPLMVGTHLQSLKICMSGFTNIMYVSGSCNYQQLIHFMFHYIFCIFMESIRDNHTGVILYYIKV